MIVCSKIKVLVADRSELASNIYKLLLSPLDLTPVVCKCSEEARRLLALKKDFELAIFNSNTFNKDLSLISSLDIKKIVICKDSDAELQANLKKINNVFVVYKPFHPDEFISVIKKTLASRE